MFLQNFSNVRFETRGNRVMLKKGQAFFELKFNKRATFLLFVEEIAKVCICTDFNEKYRIIKFTDMKQKFKVIIQYCFDD